MDVIFAGDEALMLRFGDEISPEINARVMAALAALEADRPTWIIDLVPAYASLLVRYDADRATAGEARAWSRPTRPRGPRRRLHQGRRSRSPSGTTRRWRRTSRSWQRLGG
jgi:allophanate hydrolase subunit 1